MKRPIVRPLNLAAGDVRRLILFRRSGLFLLAPLLILCGGRSILAQTEPAAAHLNPLSAEQAGRALAERVRTAAPVENAEFRGVLKIRERNGQTLSVPITCQVLSGTTSWRVIYETAATDQRAPQRLIVRHAPDRGNEYLFARAPQAGEPLAETKPVTGAETALPLAGSDFWLMDLGLEFLHWPAQRLIRTEMRKGRVCHVLESLCLKPPTNAYARVVSWIDKETGGLLLAEAYDKGNRLMKEFAVRSFKKVEGQWQLQEMEIRSVKTGRRTRLEFDVGARDTK